MSKAWVILLLVPLLGGCGAKEAGETNNAASEPPMAPDLTPNLAATAANQAAQVQALIDRALPIAVPDAAGAAYRNVRAGTGGAACGEVSSKSTKGFRTFVISPQGVAVVGTSPRIAFEDPNDFLADAYIRWCATPEELTKLTPVVQQARKDPGALGNVAAPIPDIPPPTLPPPGAPPVETRHSKASPPPPAGEIGSFFNSVQRKRD